MYKIKALVAIFILFGSYVFAQLPYPLPTAQDTSHFGKFIQRTMKLLSTSTPTHRNTVKILVYGQSISEQTWSDSVKAFLIKKYPNADIVMINRAIGGYSSQELKKPTYHDVPSFYPDLIIFHVYGSHYDLDSIMNTVRRTTTAEVLFQNSHVTGGDSASGSWENIYGYTYIPEIATKYGLEFCDVRTPWYKYLRDNNKKANDLTIDGTHLNDQGNFLMARLIERYLFANPKYMADTFKMVKTYTVGTDIKWVNGKLILPFKGNRVDLIADAPTANMDMATVNIDTKKPSETNGTRMFYLANLPFNTNWKIGNAWGWGGPMRVFSQAPLLDETWVMTITGKTSLGGGSYKIDFSVGGSQTGPDGSGSVTVTTSTGSNGAQFVSNSKRMIINGADWFYFLPDINQYNVGKKFTWQVLKFAIDTYNPPTSVNPSLETVSTLAQGITNGHHTLEITAQDTKNVPIKAVRIYYPYILRSNGNVQLLAISHATNTFCSDKKFDLTKAFEEKTSLVGPVTYWNDIDTSIPVDAPSAVTIAGIYYIKKDVPGDTLMQIVPITVTSINCKPNLTVTSSSLSCTGSTIDLTELVQETNGVSLKETSFYLDALLTQKIDLPSDISVVPPKTFYVKAISDSNYTDVKPIYISLKDDNHPCITITGINESAVVSFRLYPNPTTGAFNIEVDANESADLEITDLLGNSVFKRSFGKDGNKEIDLSSYPKGIYLAIVRMRGKSSIRKIVLY